MSAAVHRRDRKFRSTGKHAAPSPVEAATFKAGKAVPTFAVAGTMAFSLQGHASPAAALSSPVARQVSHPQLDAATPPARPITATLTSVARPAHAELAYRHTHPARTYTVRPGDTLSAIAFRHYGRARAWPWLYQVNHTKIQNPNLIFPGQVLSVPPDIPASFRVHGAGPGGTRPAQDAQPGTDAAAVSSQPQPTGSLAGTLGCSGLEQLWQQAGGAPSAEVTAASVAMAESSGQQYATGTVGERGYWQINPIHGALSTYDPYGNARAAVIISDDGTNWSPWTTYMDGAYLGQC
jgi:LysM repeat protein